MHKHATPVRTRVKVERRGIWKRMTKAAETRYEVAYTGSDGRQHWRTVGKLQEARDLRAELIAKVRRGEAVAPARTTFGEFADAWLDKQEQRLRPKTREWYGSCLRLHIKPRFGRRRLQSITVDDVAALIVEMQRGVRYVDRNGQLVRETGKPFAAWTIRGVLVVLGRVFGSALRDGLIAASPVRRLEKGERPATERREFPELDLTAIGILIAHTPQRYRTLVALSVLTGIRQSEALGLRWADVDVKAGALRVRRQLDRHGNLVEPKTNAAKRDVPMPPSLGRMLAEHRLASRHSADTDFVFCSDVGTPLGHRNVVRRGLERAIAGAGCRSSPGTTCVMSQRRR